ncbi:hypothetical protein K8W59_16155 [Nocardioides rotundus]|uniref:hypothetical protein n=1 Tax=Nocardioides rotundus TaxID=1774216 RepID=UPI001CBAE296|nr:hypothetical protein [Nocardioides rotundus]UAL29284.1 hypothetical protein K8W59_16155 [Nocardioides rotundus]
MVRQVSGSTDEQALARFLRWYRRPEVGGHALRKEPRPSSWNRATDPDQVRLREYLDDTAELIADSAANSAPWTLALNVGLPAGRSLHAAADLDNYGLPVASRLRNGHLVSVWCAKRHAAVSTIAAEPAEETSSPADVHAVRTSVAADTRAYKEKVRDAVSTADELPEGDVQLQIAFATGPGRNWLNLWKPTIDALDPILGRSQPEREWHPQDGRIVDLGLHVHQDVSLVHDVVIGIAARTQAD